MSGAHKAYGRTYQRALRDKKDMEEAKIEVMELRKERKRQQKENHEIRKQLIEIRKELRLLVGNCA